VYRRLKETLVSDGILPRQHQNTIKTPLVRVHPLAVMNNAVKFLENFAYPECGCAARESVVMPGRVPGFKNPDLLLHPCEFTKKALHGK